MKNSLLLAVSFLILLLLNACNQNNSNFVPNGKVVVSGTVLNYEKHQDLKSLYLYYHTLLDLQIIESLDIKDDGSFRITIPCQSKMDFFMGLERTAAYLICAPNDSLFITFDADILDAPKNRYPNGSYFLKVVGGTRVEDNLHVNDFMHESSQKKPSYVERCRIIENATPTEYIEYRDSLYTNDMAILDSISDQSNNSLFKLWAEDFSRFKHTEKLLSFYRDKARECKIEIDSVDIPEEYYTTILSKGINDNTIFSWYHRAFYYSYIGYLKAKAKRENSDVVQVICNNTDRFSKDIGLAIYFTILNNKSDSLVNVEYSLIEDPFIRSTLKEKIERDHNKKITLLNLKANTTITDSLFSKYKGEVVYVDIWSSWCGPCLGEMKWSMELQKEYAGKPVVFLYLCTQSKEEDWQTILKEKKIEGEHILLDAKQFQALSTLFNINGIPHYLLINRSGEITNNAPRPSNKRINQKIDQLLSE